MAPDAPRPRKAAILCATRAGPGSRACQLAAIRRALATDRRLVFAFVVEDALLPREGDVMRPAVAREMAWLGRAILGLAVHRAGDLGCRAESLLLEGAVVPTLVGAAEELGAGDVYMGASADKSGLRNWAEVLAREVESAGIMVTVVPAISGDGQETEGHKPE